MSTIEPHSLLLQAQELYVVGEKQDCLTMLSRALDATRGSDFDEVMLAAVELADVLDFVILSELLIYTFPFKEKMILRDWLYAAVMTRCLQDPSRAHRVQKLLGGLESSDVTPW